MKEILSSGGSRIFLRGMPTPKVGVLTYYFAIFVENRMKMKEFGLGGLHPWRPLDLSVIIHVQICQRNG